MCPPHSACSWPARRADVTLQSEWVRRSRFFLLWREGLHGSVAGVSLGERREGRRAGKITERAGPSAYESAELN